MSNDNNIDQQIRDQFDAFEFDYRPEHWEALSKQLDAPRDRSSLLLWPFLKGKMGIAAGIAALLSVLAAYWLWNSNQAPQATAADTQVSAPPPAVAATTTRPDTLPATDATNTPVTSGTTLAAVTRKQNTAQLKQPHPGLTASATGQEYAFTREKTQPATDSEDAVTATATILPHAKQEETTTATTATAANTDNTIYPDIDFDLKKVPDVHTALGVAGGYNYGVANSGFALGVNAKQRLTKRLYLEGDLAYIQNNNPSATSNMSNVQYKAMEDGFKAPNMASAITQIDVSNISRLSYIQFSPSLGYQLSSRFQLGLGADIQQLLQQDKDVIIYLQDKEDLKTVLNTDIGLVGQTQYKITPKLKAGLLYREGVQAAFDHKYFNRRYVQFSFNYMLFQR